MGRLINRAIGTVRWIFMYFLSNQTFTSKSRTSSVVSRENLDHPHCLRHHTWQGFGGTAVPPMGDRSGAPARRIARGAMPLWKCAGPGQLTIQVFQGQYTRNSDFPWADPWCWQP